MARKIQKIGDILGVDRHVVAQTCEQLGILVADDPNTRITDEDAIRVIKHLSPNDYEKKIGELNAAYAPSPATLLKGEIEGLIIQSIKNKLEKAGETFDDSRIGFLKIDLKILATESDDNLSASLRCDLFKQFKTEEEYSKLLKDTAEGFAFMRKVFRKEIAAYKILLDNKENIQNNTLQLIIDTLK